MHTHLVPIGNSKGVRIPATLLRQYNIVDTVELLPGENEIIIRPAARAPRKGWDEAFADMQEKADDAMMLPDFFDDEEDWEWK